MAAPVLAIIADDLTGALDAAAPLAGAAGGVVVATGPDAISQALHAAPAVVAVSSGSREVSAATARSRVEAVLEALPAGVRVIKKIDSRLKGNIAAEIEALRPHRLMVLPAIPEFGRVVRDGALQGFGVDTPIPVRGALGRFAAAAEMPDVLEQGEMAAAVAGAARDTLLVGARGLSLALAETMGLQRPETRQVTESPLCVVVGSTDPITLEQVVRLREVVPDAAHVAAPSGRVPAPAAEPAALTIIQAVPGEPAAPADVARSLAEGAVPHLRAARAMVLTGGATAEAVLDALGVSVLSVVGEAQPGLAVSRAGGQTIVTKSGGFGAPDALVRLLPHAAGAET